MPRYFLELSYKGTHYHGFQIQPNVSTIQGEVERALETILKRPLPLTTSSRTDSGVHARQNFYHFDTEMELSSKLLYNLNAILPKDIALLGLYAVADKQHARFHAVSRVYRYYMYNYKNPFLVDRAWYYPFKLDFEKLQQAANILMQYKDFTTFSKRDTQVHTFLCDIKRSFWERTVEGLAYEVESDRFLRGMVRALVGTMLKVGRGHISLEAFKQIIENKDCSLADFSTPARGLFLERVKFPFELRAAE